MAPIPIDDELKAKLFGSGDVVPLCDSSGKLLGEFHPEPTCRLEGWEQITPDISPEELEQLRASDDWTGMTTPEVIAHLRGRS